MSGFSTSDVQRIKRTAFLPTGLLKFQKRRRRLPANKVHCRIDRFEVETSAGTSIALVVSEAVTNAIKYAYPSGCGDIDIILQRRGDVADLTIRDHGVGLPENFDQSIARMDSLGIQLIMTLSETVGRVARFETDGGTRVIINDIRSSCAI